MIKVLFFSLVNFGMTNPWMRIATLNKLTFFCVVFFITAKYLWLQFDIVNYQSTISSKINPNKHRSDTPVNYTDVVIPTALTLEDAFTKVDDPVFVVYGNRGYRQILANFLCNMEIFPPMQSHILVIVTDEDTAAFLRSISNQATVFVSPTNGRMTPCQYTKQKEKTASFRKGKKRTEKVHLEAANTR